MLRRVGREREREVEKLSCGGPGVATSYEEFIVLRGRWRAIAERGQAFAHEHLHVDARMCYWRKLLQGFAHKLAYKPTLAHRPHGRRYKAKSDMVCGECRRPPNPSLIGPWPRAHPCAHASSLNRGAGEWTVRACRKLDASVHGAKSGR